MSSDREKFLNALHNAKKIRVSFFSKEDGQTIIRTCAPFDIGPSRRAKDDLERFHMWDYDSDEGSHNLSLLPEQIVKIDCLDEDFLPKDLITWLFIKNSWFTKRDWGEFS